MNQPPTKPNNNSPNEDNKTNPPSLTNPDDIPLTHKPSTKSDLQLGNPSQQLLSQIYHIIESDSSVEKCYSQKDSSKPDNNGNFRCKCKKTKCLKMYCECFALGKFCKDCLCSDCQNLIEYEDERAIAIDEALERDPDVFNPAAKQKKGGCICKKTNCLKKYCECFNSGNVCGQQCKCVNCSNRGEM